MFEESPKRFCAIIGNKATKLKNKAPTVANLVRSLDRYCSVTLPGRTPWIYARSSEGFQQFFLD